jgi:hypothetical protein
MPGLRGWDLVDLRDLAVRLTELHRSGVPPRQSVMALRLRKTYAADVPRRGQIRAS